jgi:hypothetical protein
LPRKINARGEPAHAGANNNNAFQGATNARARLADWQIMPRCWFGLLASVALAGKADDGDTE